jgi:hypothetical protein
MNYSLPAWIGALIGTIIAVAVYVPGVRILERRLRAQQGPEGEPGGGSKALERHMAFEDKLSVLRRLVLGVDIAIFAVLGYWLGTAIGGMRG